MASLPSLQPAAPVRPVVSQPYLPRVVREPDWAAQPVSPRVGTAGNAPVIRLAVTIAVVAVMAVLGGFVGMKLGQRGSSDEAATSSTAGPKSTTSVGSGATPTTADATGETAPSGATPTTETPATGAESGTSHGGGHCASSEGRCVFIDDIRLDGDRYVVAYEAVSYTPRIVGEDPDASPGDHHIHFFFDTTAPQDAGSNSSTPGRWELWDLNRGNGRMVFDRFTTADARGAKRLCAAVATEHHGVAADAAATGNCVDLPTT